MNKPLISVVIPTYKRPELLCRAIDSVFLQDYENLEIIIIDDNGFGTEAQIKTQKIINKKYNDKRIKYIPNEQSLGGGGARNKGINAAKGEFIAFLDDDEDWLPGKLNKQIDKITNACENVGVVDTGVNVIKGNVKTYRAPKMQGEIFNELLCKKGTDAPKLSTILCKKKYLEAVGSFDPEFKSKQDLDLYLRLSRICEFTSVNEPLVNKRVDAVTRISTNIKSKIQGSELLYKKYYYDYLNCPVIHSDYLISYSLMLIRAHRYFYSMKLIIRSFNVIKYKPKKTFEYSKKISKALLKSFMGKK